jgi:hypothetical protein
MQSLGDLWPSVAPRCSYGDIVIQTQREKKKQCLPLHNQSSSDNRQLSNGDLPAVGSPSRRPYPLRGHSCDTPKAVTRPLKNLTRTCFLPRYSFMHAQLAHTHTYIYTYAHTRTCTHAHNVCSQMMNKMCLVLVLHHWSKHTLNTAAQMYASVACTV